jgi:hypothetical protein
MSLSLFGRISHTPLMQLLDVASVLINGGASAAAVGVVLYLGSLFFRYRYRLRLELEPPSLAIHDSSDATTTRTRVQDATDRGLREEK